MFIYMCISTMKHKRQPKNGEKNKKRTRSDTNNSNNVPSKRRRCSNKSNAKNAHKHKTIKSSDINNKSKASSTTTKHKVKKAQIKIAVGNILNLHPETKDTYKEKALNKQLSVTSYKSLCNDDDLNGCIYIHSQIFKSDDECCLCC
eukprot:241506_1